METPIARGEHEEFRLRIESEHKRLEDEDRRQNQRLDATEHSIQELTARINELDIQNSSLKRRIEEQEGITRNLTAQYSAIDKLANNMNAMLREQERQGMILEKQSLRLEKLEHRDGEKWRKLVGYCAAAVVGGVITFLLRQIGIM